MALRFAWTVDPVLAAASQPSRGTIGFMVTMLAAALVIAIPVLAAWRRRRSVESDDGVD